MSDPLESCYVQHVLKYRPNGVTAQLAQEVRFLRALFIPAAIDNQVKELLEGIKAAAHIGAVDQMVDEIRKLLGLGANK